MYTDDELIALSGLQHLAFCERQWSLIHVEQIWKDNAETLRGDFFHERVDTKGYFHARGVCAERRVRLVNRELGIYGVADIVEYDDGGDPSSICPVEYKVGKPKASDCDRVQLAAQVMCLEEMGHVQLSEGALFYGETRTRSVVEVTGKLRARVRSLATRAHELLDVGRTPRAVFRPCCKRCSLVEECMPRIASLDADEYWNDWDIDWGSAWHA